MRRFEVRWENFRGFEDTGWFVIRPITILLGSNNSGKSSLIAPLLALKQTLRSRTPEVALVSRGELVNVGGYRDFVFRHDVERDVVFSIRWHSHEPDGDELPVGRYAPGEVRLSFSPGDGQETPVLSQLVVNDSFRRMYLTRTRRPTGSYTLNLATSPRKADASNTLQRISDDAARHERPRHFFFDGRDVFEAQVRRATEDAARELEDADSEHEVEVAPIALSDWAREYWQVASVSSSLVSTLLREISYLGPLREPLRRVYELSGDPPRDVGTRGEHAPEVLFRNNSLLSETQVWLEKFGLGRTLRATPARADGFSLHFARSGGRPLLNLADVGFGASQILPMIVQGVSAESDRLLAMEQPEIHLNPALQSTIADFLVYMAKTDRGVLVETHSEHLLMRLRTLIAKGEVGQDDVAIYFVDRDSRGRPRIRPIPVGDNGGIAPTDWPKGFFQDSVREALALATEQDRRARAPR